MTEQENPIPTFDSLPKSVADLHDKVDRLTALVEQFLSASGNQPLPEIMTAEDVSALLCKSISTIYAMTSEHRIPFRKQGNKLYFLRSEINSWLMEAVVPKDTPKRKRKSSADENTAEKSVTSACDSMSAHLESDMGGATVLSDNPIENDARIPENSEVVNPPYSIECRTHSRTGEPIFAVRFSCEIEVAGERKFNQAAHESHGYWSNFGNGGYIFSSLSDAETFAKGIGGKEAGSTEAGTRACPV